MMKQKTPHMVSNRDGNEFSKNIIASLAKRSAFQCAICSAITIGPSSKSPDAVTNIGVAAHIAAASPRGARYDTLMSKKERSSIENAIWLCQNHAKLIDDDYIEWPISRLHLIKKNHENFVASSIGLPIKSASKLPRSEIIAQEYAFVNVGSLVTAYREFIDPIVKDKNIGDGDEIGILMVGSNSSLADGTVMTPPWTVFVKQNWLKWTISGKQAGFRLNEEIPSDQIYGQIPAWPDTFFEFLEAIVISNATFRWRRHPGGYLMLAQ